MIDNAYAIKAMCVMAAVTVTLRAVPFVGARLLRRFPVVAKLGRFLPPAIMTLLLTHALYSGAVDNPVSAPWAELLSVLSAILVQLRFRHALASIFAGTALYVGLRNYPLLVG